MTASIKRSERFKSNFTIENWEIKKKSFNHTLRQAQAWTQRKYVEQPDAARCIVQDA
jgi:hypothetical protein